MTTESATELAIPHRLLAPSTFLDVTQMVPAPLGWRAVFIADDDEEAPSITLAVLPLIAWGLRVNGTAVAIVSNTVGQVFTVDRAGLELLCVTEPGEDHHKVSAAALSVRARNRSLT